MLSPVIVSDNDPPAVVECVPHSIGDAGNGDLAHGGQNLEKYHLRHCRDHFVPQRFCMTNQFSRQRCQGSSIWQQQCDTAGKSR